MKVCFDTFGCRLNKAEALQMEADYLAKGWELTEKHSDANLIIVRGCSVTARAQRECEQHIAHLHRHYPTIPVRVYGCLKEEKGVRAASPSPREPVSSQARPLPTRTARAYLKVQDGCNGKCTFCIVPKFRGNSTSVPFEDVTDTARRFIEAGYHEIVVTGCNLSLYASAGKRLPELLAALAELGRQSSPCRIRLGSLEPGSCALETVQAMAEYENVCRFLHIPIQSGSNRILSAMRRPYLVRDIDALVSAALAKMPAIGLGCDVMTGFPDESDMDFIMTRGLLERLPFNNAHVFPYSERPGTLAAALGGALPKDVRSSRAHTLSRLIAKSRKRYARTFVGQTVEIVTESESKISGWTGEYLACEAVGTVPRKSLVRLFVTGIKDDRLTGRLV